MVWKLLLKNIHYILLPFGIGMEVVGMITSHPYILGISIAYWGAICAQVCFLIIILQLCIHIKKTENSYKHALNFERVTLELDHIWNEFQFVLKFNNTIDKPLGCEIDIDKTYIKLSDKQHTKLQYDKSQAKIIPRLKSRTFPLPKIPINIEDYPISGTLYYELKYGHPDNPKFTEDKEYALELTLGFSSGGALAVDVTFNEVCKKDGKT